MAATLREDLQKRIERKLTERVELEQKFERQKAAADAYIQALQDTLNGLPRDGARVKPRTGLRSGGAIARVREMILAAQRPLHLDEILKGLGKAADKKSRASVGGALGNYVRRGEVFSRTGPNTFGLIELGHTTRGTEDEPPPGFGSVVDER